MIGRWPVALLHGALVALSLMPPAEAETVIGEGVIRSDERVVIKSKVPGPIRRILVREGDVIAGGQPLLEMDNETSYAMVEAAAAEVRRAAAALLEVRGALETATREYERLLKVRDLITVKEFELSRDAVRNAQAAMQTRKEELFKAQKQLDVARANFNETLIVAPFNGVVSRIHVREGDSPKVSETPLLDVLSLEKLYLEVALPLPYLGRIREGMTLRFDVEGETTAIRTSSTGKISYVYPEVDPRTRMFLVKISVPPAGSRVLPGMFAKVRIELQGTAR
ncbi:MAG: efflux RND transporter periplasmic adaptor subunit [Candidatus Rokubacteria bacterium]|nr:efflux RND transporter periplasmic adaptor subunit [Candidatus Rokubacteria bacterium]